MLYKLVAFVMIAFMLAPVVVYAQDELAPAPEVKVVAYSGNTFGVHEMIMEADNVRAGLPIKQFTASSEHIGIWINNPDAEQRPVSIRYMPVTRPIERDITHLVYEPSVPEAKDWVTIYGLEPLTDNVLGYEIPPHSAAYVPFSFMVPGDASVPQRWAFSIEVKETTGGNVVRSFWPTMYVSMYQPLWYMTPLAWLAFFIFGLVALTLIIYLLRNRVAQR